jgi:hypothetical protein
MLLDLGRWGGGHPQRLFWYRAIRLSITDVKGKTVILDLNPCPFNCGPSGGNGGAGPYPMVVSLPPGANYIFPVDLEDYIPADSINTDLMYSRERKLPLMPGRYILQAAYSSTNKASNVNHSLINTVFGPDGKPFYLDDPTIPYWTDTTTSNKLRFTISQQTAP